MSPLAARRGAGRWPPLPTVLGLATLLVDHRYFFYGDTPAAYYGWWFHLGDLVRHGQWPVIDPPAWRAGNIAAEGQWGLWSPLLIAIGLVASVSNMLVVATGVKVALAVGAARRLPPRPVVRRAPRRRTSPPCWCRWGASRSTSTCPRGSPAR